MSEQPSHPGLSPERAETLLAHITAAQKPLHAFIFSLMLNAADAEDVLQETNLVLWRKAAEYDADRPFLRWACHIAYLQVLAFMKRRARPEQMLSEMLLMSLAEKATARAETLDDRVEALRMCLKQVRPDDLRLLALRYQMDESTRSVAERVGRPEGSVRVTLHRIRRMLLDCINRRLARGAV